jgi:hypothetical protein
MGREQEEQLRDYLEISQKKAPVPYQRGTVNVSRLVYAFMEPEGVLANRVFISKALGEGVAIRVYNKAGFARDFTHPSLVEDVISFATSIHP